MSESIIANALNIPSTFSKYNILDAFSFNIESTAKTITVPNDTVYVVFQCYGFGGYVCPVVNQIIFSPGENGSRDINATTGGGGNSSSVTWTWDSAASFSIVMTKQIGGALLAVTYAALG